MGRGTRPRALHPLPKIKVASRAGGAERGETPEGLGMGRGRSRE